jgi:hypothetical protein
VLLKDAQLFSWDISRKVAFELGFSEENTPELFLGDGLEEDDLIIVRPPAEPVMT